MLFEINFEARGTDDPACPQEVNWLTESNAWVFKW